MAETETSSSNLSGPSLDELAADNPGTMDDMDSADFFSELDKSVNAVTYGPGELEQESQPVVTTRCKKLLLRNQHLPMIIRRYRRGIVIQVQKPNDLTIVLLK